MNKRPPYIMRDNNPSQIVVAFPMCWQGEDAPEFWEYKGRMFKRGMMRAIPYKLCGDLCSVREYDFHDFI